MRLTYGKNRNLFSITSQSNNSKRLLANRAIYQSLSTAQLRKKRGKSPPDDFICPPTPGKLQVNSLHSVRLIQINTIRGSHLCMIVKRGIKQLIWVATAASPLLRAKWKWSFRQFGPVVWWVSANEACRIAWWIGVIKSSSRQFSGKKIRINFLFIWQLSTIEHDDDDEKFPVQGWPLMSLTCN